MAYSMSNPDLCNWSPPHGCPINLNKFIFPPLHWTQPTDPLMCSPATAFQTIPLLHSYIVYSLHSRENDGLQRHIKLCSDRLDSGLQTPNWSRAISSLSANTPNSFASLAPSLFRDYPLPSLSTAGSCWALDYRFRLQMTTSDLDHQVCFPQLVFCLLKKQVWWGTWVAQS